MNEATLVQHPYSSLTPDVVLDAVESLGFVCDARIFPLNSYENRVYQVGIEDEAPLIVKFYRPGRWQAEQIQEEHDFSAELDALDVPVVAPWRDNDNRSLFEHEGFMFALYPRRGGRAPDLEAADDLEVLGRLMGRLHAVGTQRTFQHRPTLSVQSFGTDSVSFLVQSGAVPESLLPSYEAVAMPLLEGIEAAFAAVSFTPIRLHGDCHPGNILWRDGAAHFVDLDDARNGPAIQDLWMLLTGDRAHQTGALSDVMEGYQQFHDFNFAELALIEPLRALRSLHYAAWLARRWEDPSFPMHFPWFGDERYWGEHIMTLREHVEALQEPPLTLW
ncbi:MAG: serine/threonine protein kinase [Natronospirillum sp.]|uniref:serine/threonine protein kinase n=1 Tax=Natronospirillum sp. TaxID=2812955 RepID=UPI0025D68548|nr:serine/threonine protein kinase [Natronospirillum sp.]MCH8550743.1 serine/threonine protein kinase [Natronospirillum sp.]